MYFDFATILIFIAIAIFFVFVALLVGRILRPHNPYPQKLETYECGEKTIGSSWLQFNIRFYIIALIFLIFEVEIAVLFPWITIFKKFGALAFIEMIIFIGILLVGLIYVWAKGDLEWVKSLYKVNPVRKDGVKESDSAKNGTQSDLPKT